METQNMQLESLYNLYSKTVYWAAFGVLHDQELSADVMQNVFLRAYKHLETLSGMTPAQCRAWLYRSAVNASIDVIRRNKKIVPVEDAGLTTQDPSDGPEEQAEKNAMRQAIQDALQALPDKYREPLTLYYFAELDYKEIAALLNTNEGTLKSRMSRGRGMLEKLLRKGGGVHAS